MTAAARTAPVRVTFVSGEPHTPGHRYRVENIASALPSTSFEVSVISLPELRTRFREVTGTDVLWVWRAPLSRSLRRVMESARAGGAKVVVDVDDLVFDPRIATSDLIDGNRHLDPVRRVAVRRQFSNIRSSLLLADHCTAPTRSLARQIEALGKHVTVIPNGADDRYITAASRCTVGAVERSGTSGIRRIGYAAGTRTHQRDLAVALPALTRILDEFPDVGFTTFDGAVDLGAFPTLRRRHHQVELRPLVALDELPGEYERFDVNIAPLEVGNPFCEAKSELKYFESALSRVVTVASPTETFSLAIRHGETGLLAHDEESWYGSFRYLLTNSLARSRMVAAAHAHARRTHGPEQRTIVVESFLSTLLSHPLTRCVPVPSLHGQLSATDRQPTKWIT